MLHHLPFFEALSRLEEGSAEWRLTSAGFVTLRLFDAWVVEGPSVVAADAWGLRAVRDAIDAIDTGSTSRSILSSIVDAMEGSRLVRIAVVAPRLLAYSRSLQLDGRFALAADVYRTILAHAHPVEEGDVVIAASIQLGVCLRAMAEWTEAAASYMRASSVAAMTGDMMSLLRVRIAEASMAMDRGNFPKAQQLLDETIADAAANSFTDVKARALHSRAVVAIHRHEPDLAVKLAYDALRDQTDAAERDRILSDLGVAFFDLGMRSAARDAYLILAATAQAQYSRWVATINLIECAAADGREPVFEQYRRELADEELPSTLAVHYYYYVGDGYRLFGKVEQARAALEKSLALASQHGMNEMIIRAEQSLKQVRDGGVVIIAEAAAPNREVEEVAEAIHEMSLAAAGR
jgi:tetratricopeptide (TPR) repeat protein